jgi:hypothetical protein
LELEQRTARNSQNALLLHLLLLAELVAKVTQRASAAPCTYLIFFIHASIGPLTVLSGVSKEKTSDM